MKRLILAALIGCSGAEPNMTPDAATVPGEDRLRVAFTSTRLGPNYQLFVVDDDGTHIEQVTSSTGSSLSPSWSPDGAKIAFASNRSGRYGIYTLDLATRDVALVSLELLTAANPVISPDGNSIAFQGRVSGQVGFDIYVVASSGGAARQLTEAPRNDSGPAWSPDGRTLYFVSDRSTEGVFEVYAMDPAGEDERAVTTNQHVIGRPTALPDGTSIAYATGDARTAIVRFVLATQEIVVLTNKDDSEPAFSPDGKLLVHASARSSASDIMILDLTSGASRTLTDDAAIDGSPAVTLLKGG